MLQCDWSLLQYGHCHNGCATITALQVWPRPLRPAQINLSDGCDRTGGTISQYLGALQWSVMQQFRTGRHFPATTYSDSTSILGSTPIAIVCELPTPPTILSLHQYRQRYNAITYVYVPQI